MGAARTAAGDTGCLWVSGGRPAARVLFAVGPSGTGAAVWQDVRLAADPGLALAGVRLPGRESRMAEPLCDSAEALGADVAATVAAVAAGCQLMLAGLCFGAVVGYEAARQLALAGARPARLIVVDAVFGPPRERFAADLGDDEFASYARDRRLLRDWVWDEPQLAALLVRQLRSDITAHSHYDWPAAGRPVADRVTAVTGRHLDAAEARTWEGAGERLDVVEPAADLSDQLMESPALFSLALDAILHS